MIRLKRPYLTIIKTETEQDSVSWDEFLDALLEKPSNIIYFETDERLYGIASFGDVSKAKEQALAALPINKNFTSLGPDGNMTAREYFREDKILSEIPIIEDGKLTGEFDRFDSLLLLERMRDWKYNRYAKQFWTRSGRIALVRPGAGRTSKLRIFDDWQERLSGYGADVTCLSLAELAGRESGFDKILFVDETELRGAKVFLELFDGYTMTFDVTRTFGEMVEKMGESRMMDYEEAIAFYRDQGVRVLTITLRDPDSDYSRRVQKECRERYPGINDNTLNEQMKKYDREFFDDLYDPEYARTLEGGFFSVEKTRSTLRLHDTESKYVNIKSGERRTVGQPDDYTRSVFFYGACLPIGAYADDEHTMESCLQAMLNEKGYRVRVVNYGSWGGNIACFGRMATSFIREGDIVVLLLEEFDMEGEDTINLWEPLEENAIPSEWLLDNPFHCNHHVLKCYAEAIFEKLFGEGYEDNARTLPPIRRQPGVVKQFYTDKYFYGWDPAGAEKTISCNINGNPFTLGHVHLVQAASEIADRVVLFSLEEEAPDFTFAERYTMAFESAKGFSNVTVVPSGLFLSNVSLFPAYYARVHIGDVREQAEAHIETFAEIAKVLGITSRIVGEEPHDPITNEINKAMISLMPGYGLEPVIIPRLEIDGRTVTGTYVRQLACDGRDEELRKYVPEPTFRIIKGETPQE